MNILIIELEATFSHFSNIVMEEILVNNFHILNIFLLVTLL